MRSGRSQAVATAVIAVVLLAGCSAPKGAAVGPIAATVEREQAKQELIENSRASVKAMESLVHGEQPGCSAAVGIRGDVVWAGARGIANLAEGTRITTGTRFDMASVSKQFTATAILMLQREGALSVSDPIGLYVDDLPSWGDTVTLDQLIHHTSRVQDYWVELDDEGIGFTDAADQEQTVNAIRRLDELEPGEGFFYSNSNYVLLAEVVARATGQSLPQFLAERIFAPLGLGMTVAPTVLDPDVALSYNEDFVQFQGGWTSYGHSGIITTPSELVRWGDQYRAGGIIQDDFAEGAVDEAEGELYAAGMDIEVDGDLNHTGRMGGYITEFTVSEDRQLSIAVMCNTNSAPRFPLADALWEIWRPTED